MYELARLPEPELVLSSCVPLEKGVWDGHPYMFAPPATIIAQTISHLLLTDPWKPGTLSTHTYLPTLVYPH